MPFLCEIKDLVRPLSGSDVLAGLNARHFRSEHIPNLGAKRIAYPGYRPYSDNDEIHNDFAEQYIFEHDDASAFDGAHGKLKQYVVNNQLWYVLLHPTKHDRMAEFVFLFAVGLAPSSNQPLDRSGDVPGLS